MNKLKIMYFFLRWLGIRLKNLIERTSQVSVSNFSKIHKTSRIENAYLHGDIEINQGVTLTKGVHITGNVSIGDFTSVSGPNTDIYSSINKIIIGKFCSIARNVSFQEYYHSSSRISTFMINTTLFLKHPHSDLISKGDIIIGNDVWIGMHSVVLSGVKIGNGVIVAANSVVNSDIPDYAVVAGSPAKIVKYRFSRPTIELLNKVCWWDWDLDKLKINKELFQTDSEIEIIEWLKKLL